MAFFICTVVILAGCGQQSGSKEGQSAEADSQCSPAPVRHFDSENKAESLARQVNGVDKAVAVKIDDELDVALQVSNFNRLRLKQLRKEVFQKLNEAYPQAKVHVTTDSKLYNELEKMNGQPWSDDKTKACEQKQKLKQIEEKMKG
jgi:hypothetical protein